jgi:flagellar biosynthesis anti-sigma factor FlgM
MKIEGERPNVDVAAAKRLEQLKALEMQKRTVAQEEAAQSDNIAVSAEARLAAATIKSVAESPAFRQDVVDKVRQQILQGEIGHDPEQLAEKLIDHLLEDR